MKIFLYALCMILSAPVWSQGTWTEKNLLPDARTQAMGFSLAGKGYLLGGLNGDIDERAALWEWDPATDLWISRTSMPAPRVSGTAFSLGDKAYVTGGFANGFYADLLEWDPIADTWTPKASFPAAPRAQSGVFTIGDKAYLIGGFDDNYQYLSEFWEWDQATDTWTQKADLPGPLFAVAAFAIGGKGYIFAGGTATEQTDQLWEWDPVSDTWTEKSKMPPKRVAASAFVIGKRAYICGGEDDYYFNDFWSWDSETDTWMEETALPGRERARHVAFTIEEKGYVLSGASGPFGILQDLWEWTPDVMNSLEEPSRKIIGFRAFPNPTSDFCRINCKVESGEKVRLRLFDRVGQLCLEEEHLLLPGENRLRVEMADLPIGVYVAEVQGADWREKLMLEKF